MPEMTEPADLPNVIEEWAAPGRQLPLVLKPRTADTDLIELVAAHRPDIRQRLRRYGGILFRGFADVTPATFRELMTALSAEPLDYVERSSPRHEVGDKVYTSTDHPAAQEIFLHNEQSYNLNWPQLIFFHCVQEPGAGGATPIADCRKVYRRISEETRRRLEERKYCYVRHFGGRLGLSWREAFQTADRAEVEAYCDANGISFSWGEGDTLTTRQVREVSRRHPVTGETTWFNHLVFFNVQLFDPGIVKALMSMGKDRLPNNTYYGDGADIEPEVVEELRAAYLAEKVAVPWQAGDILVLDNMLVAHGRESFKPPRQIIVGMTEPLSAHA
ncbi:TauD/TfdA family dioxygenase [Streptomyces sp. FXJ1.172]|uniref:TauD/TfdA family dioxygenase n=1 Tax=Streptomyces sp. FXJ1.172 TaxID=710705 RepID=UPI00082C98BE|nr:TauD/TfdA family dioxygenase [Streptomyces sp. FXJ1.172]WEO95421.1 TauD/TfdA family dioxygenase [Streptomyces sp. FXJ1.172]